MTTTSLRAPAFAAAAAGIAIYSGVDAIMKRLTIQSGAYDAVLWRSVAGVVLTGAVFVARRRPWPGSAALRLHAGRGIAAGLSVLLFFWGLARVPMTQGVALTFLAPLVALYLAAALLGEEVGRGAVQGSIVALLGVLAIAGEVRVSASAAAVPGMLAIIAASILYAYSLILLRRQAQVADPLEVTLFTGLVLGGLLLIGSPWFASVPAAAQAPAILAAAALASISSVLLAWAYARAEAQWLAPIEYTAFVWAAILGFAVFGERLSGWTVAGALLIGGGCSVAVRRPIAAAQTEASA